MSAGEGYFRVTCFLMLAHLSVFAGTLQPGDSNYPEDYRQKLADRKRLEEYQIKEYAVEKLFEGRAYPSSSNRHPGYSNIISSLALSGVPSDLPEKVMPTLGFRANIWNTNINERDFFPQFNPDLASDPLVEIVRSRLATDGVLLTLTRMIEQIGVSAFKGNPDTALKRIVRAGFPADWLDHFECEGKQCDAGGISFKLLSMLEGGQGPDQIDLSNFKFAFHQTHPGFLITSESGETSPGLLRIQIGGGYENGIVPGSSLEASGQLAGALPEAQFLIAVEDTFFEPLQWVASHVWTANKHLTLLKVNSRLSGWAQDNGKPGTIPMKGGRSLALLVPRYASFDDAISLFAPAESYVMRGMKQAGIEVIQSPLLFQGGNVLATRDGVSGRRVLIISDTALYHTMAAGLTRDQTLEAFRIEFGADECIVLSPASYHLDYEVTIRTEGNETIAFVNDPGAAARLIMKSGLEALQRVELLSGKEAAAAKKDLAAKNWRALESRIWALLKSNRNSDGKLQSKIASALRKTVRDPATSNLRCFLVALDVLVADAEEEIMEEGTRSDYLQSLRRLLRRGDAFNAGLETRGWKIVKVPSMPEFNFSINYLNSVQYKDAVILPAWGGLYENLDSAAIKAFQASFAKTARLIAIPCASSQMHHGAIHCMVSSFEPVN
jgi:hypothetical protein